ncbi:hypothetical protein G6F68_019915 [Rhizopus microsporus]|nr:hypothetical protein G6F68_019915 [Rhizopus microsporus]
MRSTIAGSMPAPLSVTLMAANAPFIGAAKRIDGTAGGVQLRAVQQYRPRWAGQVRRHRDARTEHGADDVRQSLHALAEIEDFR